MSLSEGDSTRNLIKPSATATNRTATHWTAPMDSCFIGLLLEQVNNGNIFGHTVRSQAWREMIESINEQFGTQHDLNVLKHRYKNLKKLFDLVCNLLQQSGFSWDDAREMVVAEGHVWEAYTEVHPEVRPIRGRALPGFSKLCVIFGGGSSHTRYIRLSHNADPSVESQALLTGKQKNGSLPGVYDAASTIIEWTESMESLFIDLMVEQVNRGNRILNSFNEEAWTCMIKAFSTKLGLQCDKQFLEDQYVSFMKRHDCISKLLSHNGFAWDETLQMILAEDDVWQGYLKHHPEAISYKNKPLHGYHALCKIFGNKVSYQRASVQGQLQLMEVNDIATEMNTHGTSSNFLVSSNSEISNQDRKKPKEQQNVDETSGNFALNNNNGLTKASSHRSRKRSSGVPLKDKAPRKELRLKVVLPNKGGVAKAEMNKNEKKEKNESFEDALLALKALHDELDEELVLDACDLLEDEKKAFTFLTLNDSMRKKWLLRKLRP